MNQDTSSYSNYNVYNLIGEGTYGCVYKAVDKRTQALVAMKILNKFNEEEGISYSALQELKWLRLLANVEGTVKLLDAFVHEQKLVLVFNYADCDLTGICVKGPKLQLAEVKCLMRQMLEAVFNIHSRFLMHRDIKAANILLHKGRVMLADMGMMTHYKAHESFSPNCITLWYRAPELLLGQCKYGPEVDMWSVGCVFIELVTQKSPFPGYTEQEQMDKIFQAIGTPNEETWGSEATALPGWKSLRKNLYKPQLEKFFRDWDREARDLLMKLLAPPKSRISAEEALKHPFFFTDPLPCDIARLPQFESVRELDVKKKTHTREDSNNFSREEKRPRSDNVLQNQLSRNLPGQTVPKPNPSHVTVPSPANGKHTMPPATKPPAQMKPSLPSNGKPFVHYGQKPNPHAHAHAQYPSGKGVPRTANGKIPSTVPPQKGSAPLNGSVKPHVEKVFIPPQQDTQHLHIFHNTMELPSVPKLS